MKYTKSVKFDIRHGGGGCVYQFHPTLPSKMKYKKYKIKSV